MAIGVTLKVAFDSKAVRRGLAGIKTGIASIAKAGMGIAKVGTAIAALGIAGVAAVGAIALKINAIGEAAVTSENRVKSIVKQMDLFGSASDDVAKRMIDLAKVSARQTGIDEEIIQLTQAKLSTFKELAQSADTAGGAFDRATAAAIDMAAAGFGEAEQNAVQLGKALNDPIKGINSLTRSGITFTAEEKKKIAVLVQSNQMLKAQDIVLKAIEKQVGGTARATADASQQVKVSLGQVVEAFAKPFSAGFNALPGALESVFPALIEKASRIGGLVSNAIADAVAGNYAKFMAIGELIGTILTAGAEKTFKTGMRNLGASVLSVVDSAENGIRNATGLSKLIGNSTLGARATEAAGAMSDEDTRQAVNAIKIAAEAIARGNQGLVPGTGGRFQYAAPGVSTPFIDKDGNRVVEVLNRIEQNTSGGSKM